MRFKKSIFSILVVLLLTVFLFLPVKIPYSITVPGRVLPSKEWVLTKGSDGRLISFLNDNAQGVSSHYTVSQFERGDAIKFQLKECISSGKKIRANDTVGIIYSNEIQRQLISLKGDLAVARASLTMNQSGEKDAIIKAAVETLSLRKKEAEEQLKVFQRLDVLYKRNLVSQEEYELAKGTAELNQINIKIAEAQLQAAQTGSKSEELHLLQTQIQSLEQQLSALQQRFDCYTITSSISGIARMSAAGDTILVINDTSSYIIVMPVKWENRHYVRQGQSVSVSIPDLFQEGTAEIKTVDNGVKRINGAQVYAVKARCSSQIQHEVTSGLIVGCTIHCDSVTPLEFLKRFLKTLFQ